MTEGELGALRVQVVPVTALQQNCTLIWDDETLAGVVVDPGGEASAIVERTETLGLRIERILLTHGHLDHAAGASELRDLLGVPVDGPDQRDQFLLDTLELEGKRWSMEAINIVPERFLKEGDSIPVGPHRLDVLHVPGHTPGHIVFVERGARFAQVGDTLFRGSIGRADFSYGDQALLIAGIKEKLLPLGDDVRFVCGHGPASSIGEERRSNPFLQG